MGTRRDVSHSTASGCKSVGTMTSTTRCLTRLCRSRSARGARVRSCRQGSEAALAECRRGSHRHARRRAKLVDSSRRRG